MARFIWEHKNIDHIAEHGVTPGEAEYVVEHGVISNRGENKWRAVGRTKAGRYLHVVYVLESDLIDIDYTEIDLLQLEEVADSFYVIHARPLTEAEKSAFKKRKRKGNR